MFAIAIGKHERDGLDSTQIIRADFEHHSRDSLVQYQFCEQIGTQTVVPHKIERRVHP